MDLSVLILYAVLNATMVLIHLLSRNRIYEFPFWAGAIALGWFLPQAFEEYAYRSQFPDFAYLDGMLFASLCTLALWIGFRCAYRRVPAKGAWLDIPFDLRRLSVAGAMLCTFGFFFQWKLSSLPDEVLAQTQWSGAAVKYLFLASVFVFGFITLWLVYLSEGRVFAPHLLLFLVPCLMLLLKSALLHGRRAVMMDLASYFIVGFWLVRRVGIPRWVLVSGLVLGLLLVNSIGIYRSIMSEKDRPLSERIESLFNADFSSTDDRARTYTNLEFKNYIFYRFIHARKGLYDYGLMHWNQFVFNYVPAQIVGREVKNSLMLKPRADPMKLAEEEFGHAFYTGTTTTGYCDAFASFGWFGFIKFTLIGWIMGVLYRHAMQGAFLAQLLYLYSLGPAMHAITHHTHKFLVSGWVYFFMLGFPLLYLAHVRRDRLAAGEEEMVPDGQEEWT